METITIYCNDDSIEYSKNRWTTFTHSFDDDIIIPQSLASVKVFLTFLDTCSIPTVKVGGDSSELITILDIAQFCNLKDNDIPGKNYLIDLVYENMENEFGIQMSFLFDFDQTTGIDIYDYKFCKFVIQQWQSFLVYGIAMNTYHKAQQIEKIIEQYTTYNA